MPAIVLAVAAGALPPAAASAATPPSVTTFTYTGAEQAYRIPAGVTRVSVTAVGAPGGTTEAHLSAGGLGGTASSVVTVDPGATLYVEVGGAGGTGEVGVYPVNGVGGAGGFNGGAAGGVGTFNLLPAPGPPAGDDGGGGGGGASDVRAVPAAVGGSLGSRLVVAAGGGGGTQSSTGGGGSAGQPGHGNPYSVGQPGTATAGGAAGDNGPTTPAGAGALGVGGFGGSFGGDDDTSGGGGGGGGLYGGGGGAIYSGGGGGSSSGTTTGLDPTGVPSVTITSAAVGADLATSLEVPPTARPGSSFAAVLTVTDGGPGPAGRTWVLLLVPAGLRVTDAGGGRVSKYHGRTRVLFRLAGVGVGAPETFRVTLSAATWTRGRRVLTACARSVTADPRRGNNHDRTTVLVE